MNWHYVDNGQPAGPVAEEQLAELRRTGRVVDGTLVWREGMANWTPLREALPPPTATADAPAAEPPRVGETKPGAVCSECGRLFNREDMIRHGEAYVCAQCKPVFIQKLSEGVHVDGTLSYAGFWVRFAAKFVDGLILGIPFIVVYFLLAFRMIQAQRPDEFPVFLLLWELGFFAVQATYEIVFVGHYGATPGKMLCKLRVVTADGERVGYGRATGRYFASKLSEMVCYIGFIMVAFDSQKRGLHDHICSTRVIQTGT
jgi:uncharacterized RDD family membrane protein YckC